MNNPKGESTRRKTGLILSTAVGLTFLLLTGALYQTRILTKQTVGSGVGLKVELRSDKPQVSVGEDFSVEVFVSGQEAGNVSAADMTLSYDGSSARLIDYGSGGYWPQGVLLSSDVTDNEVKVAVGRGVNDTASALHPLATFRFKVESATGNRLQFMLSETTQFAKLGAGAVPIKYAGSAIAIPIK